MVPFGGYQIRPENALQRAQELLEVGKKIDALETLHEVIKSRKLNRAGWTKSHELIMLKHLELCVELRKPHLAKDGLFQYRNMVQQINVKSLENVILYLLTLSETKAETARQESQDLVEDVVDDLDQADSPESLLLASVSRTDAQDRADRTVLSPWLRFLWDAYRQCLELLRNNAQVEQLYHKVARQAFDFCLKYSRRAEFRKLCDNLRGHLNQLQKSQHLSYAVKLNNIDTLMMQQDTRLKQLDIAIQMELWQEAFKSAEDVHNLMAFSKERIAKTMVKGQALANYYEKLALVLWKAGDKLHHAAALFRLFQHTKEMKKSFSTEENSHHATRVLLATLSIGPGAGVASDLCRYLDMEETMTDNQRRLAQLLELSAPPTRASLLRELYRSNVIQAAAPAAQQLYRLLDNMNTPLRLASKIETELKNVENLDKEDYTRYIESLTWVSALRILHQISEVYETISLSRLQAIIPFYDNTTLQKLLVHAGKRGYVRMRIDHRAGCIEFVQEETLAHTDEDTQMRMADESLPGESLKACLLNLYAALGDITNTLTADHKRKEIETNLNRSKVTYRYHHNDDYMKILERKRIIEQFKESCERKREERLRIEELTAAQLAEQQRIHEQRRLMEEEREFQIQKERNQKDEMNKKIVQDKLEKLTKTEIGRQVLSAFDETEIETLSTEALFQKQIEKLNTIKKEQASKLKAQEKKWDHLVRALHEEEVEFRAEDYRVWKDVDYDFWMEYEKNRVHKAKEDHKEAVETFDRLERVREDAATFLSNVKENRKETLLTRTENWKKKLADTKQTRLREKREAIKQRKRAEWLENKRMEEEHKRKEAERLEKEKDRPPRPERSVKDRDDDGEQRADADDNWRRGAPPQAQPSNTQQAFRQNTPDGPWQRGQMQEVGPGRSAERVPMQGAADSGPWQRGQMQEIAPARSTERVPMQGAADTGPWRQQPQEVPSHRGPERMPMQGAADTGPWRQQPQEVQPQRGPERMPMHGAADTADSWRRDRPAEQPGGPPPSTYRPPMARASGPSPPAAAAHPPGPPAENAWHKAPIQEHTQTSWRQPTAGDRPAQREERPWRPEAQAAPPQTGGYVPPSRRAQPPQQERPYYGEQQRQQQPQAHDEGARQEGGHGPPPADDDEGGFQTVSTRRMHKQPQQQHYAENPMFDMRSGYPSQGHTDQQQYAHGYDERQGQGGYDRRGPPTQRGGYDRPPQDRERWGPSSNAEPTDWRSQNRPQQQRRDDRGGGSSAGSWRN